MTRNPLFGAVLFFVGQLLQAAPSDSAQTQTIFSKAIETDSRITSRLWHKLDADAQMQFVSNTEPEYLVLFEAEMATSDQNQKPSTNSRLQHKVADINRRQKKLWAYKDLTWRREYNHMPVAKIRLKNKKHLYELLADDAVVAVAADRFFYPALSQSLPLISQTMAVSGGLSGANVSIAIVDTGIDHTNPVFGCSAPGVPASCRIAHLENIAKPGDAFSSHGTQVAAIAASVAPASKIIGLDVKGPEGILTSDLLSAIDWMIAHKETYKIAAANFSLGSTSTSAAPCDNPFDPLYVGFNLLQAEGILPVVASGNGSIANGISSPGCYSAAFSVGATFDRDYAGHNSCGGASVATDEVACFSNSAYFLKMLAPGATINAAGYQGAGTSWAAPHVAGAAALVMSQFPELTLDELKMRLLDSTVPVVDTRNGYTFPRLDLSSVLVPDHDLFSNAETISVPRTIVGTSVFSSREPGEALSVQSSVWYKFTPQDTPYQISLSASSSQKLSLYSGTGSLQQLTLVGTITGGTSALFQLAAGRSYYIQVHSSAGGSAFTLTLTRPSDENIPFVPIWALGLLLSVIGVGWQLRLGRPHQS